MSVIKIDKYLNSFFKLKLQDADKELYNSIRDEYGVDYLIRGSMQIMGQNGRLNLEITDLKTKTVSVSKKTDFQLREIFKVQDELSNEILSELSINMGVGKGQGSDWAKQWESMEAFILYLNWRNEWRKFTKKGYINSLRMLDEIKGLYPGENVGIMNLESWQLFQKLRFGIVDNKDNDLKRLTFLLNRTLDLEPTNVDSLAARALIGIQLLDRDCKDSLLDIKKTEQLGSTVDTLTIAGGVYQTCGEMKKSIKAIRNALELVPNDFGWFITTNLVMALYKDGQKDEILKLIGNDIEAEDMGSFVLAIYAFLEQENGNMDKAKKYLDRAKKNGLNLVRFENSLKNHKELHKKTIDGLKKIGELE